MQNCRKCGQEKPLVAFHKDRARPNGYRNMCKSCYSDFHAKYYEENTEKVKSRNRRIWIERIYGKSLEEIENIKQEQQNCCALCGDLLDEKDNQKVHIDHDHKTGKVRGILCRWCNTGLGQFRDSIERLGKAIAYLQKER